MTNIEAALKSIQVGNTFFSKKNPMRVYEVTAVDETAVHFEDDVGEYVKPIYEFVQNYTRMFWGEW